MGTLNATIHHNLARRLHLHLIILLAVLLSLWAPANAAFADAVAIPQPEQPALTVQGNAVVLNWVYTVDPGISTYTLERSANLSRADAITLSAPVLSATGDGNPIVAYYTMIDDSAEAGHAYAYWLTTTDQYGNAVTAGPWTIGQVDDASEHLHLLFLPFVAS